ncbi:MAG TPA: substrate-binding domain-containing protein [Bacteroidales bacterium]|nr:substrate-binding domain-containing protein [Bacteroidales bacterium]
MKKLLLSLLILSAGILALAQTPITIGFSVGDFSADRFSQEPAILQKAAEKYGAHLMVRFANGNSDQQIKQARELIDSGANVLIVFPSDAEKCAAIIPMAHKAGVKVIAYDRIIKNADVDFYLSFDNEIVGKQMAEYAIAKKPKGNYVLMGGPLTDYNSVLLMNGQEKILDPAVKNGDIKIVFEKHLETWNSIEAFNALQKLLDDGIKPDAIIASNDELAAGAVMALDMQYPEWNVLITGQDASLKGCQNILDGKQTMTVYKPFPELAETAANIAVKMVKDEPLGYKLTSINNGKKDVPALLLRSKPVDKSNMRETVIKDGFVSEDQLSF